MSILASLTARAVPVRGNDIDTDRIIPARFLRCVVFDGLGEHAFADDRAQLKTAGKQHPFDQPRFAGAGVLVVNANFGCGSSREHAPQAIARWGRSGDAGGIRAIVGVSFSEIFLGNCVAMGLPCVAVKAEEADALQSAIEADPGLHVTVDIEARTVSAGSLRFAASIADGPRQQFLTGAWDALGGLLAGLDQVRETAKRLPYVSGFAT